MIKIVIKTGLIALASSASAYVSQPIDEKAPLTMAFSHTSHNRIRVSDGAVVKAIGDGNFFSVNLDKATGQAFVAVTQEIKEPTTLSILTSSGAVQDIIITSKDGPGEYILLQEEPEEIESYGEVDFQATTVDFLNQVLQGDIPLGYGQTDIEPHMQFDLPSPLFSQPVKAFEGPFDQIVLYKIVNKGKAAIHLKAEVLKKPQHTWVFLCDHELSPSFQTYCIVATPKDEASS